eukprot:2507590-Amphidinium_carterae.1
MSHCDYSVRSAQSDPTAEGQRQTIRQMRVGFLCIERRRTKTRSGSFGLPASFTTLESLGDCGRLPS